MICTPSCFVPQNHHPQAICKHCSNTNPKSSLKYMKLGFYYFIVSTWKPACNRFFQWIININYKHSSSTSKSPICQSNFSITGFFFLMINSQFQSNSNQETQKQYVLTKRLSLLDFNVSFLTSNTKYDFPYNSLNFLFPFHTHTHFGALLTDCHQPYERPST